MSYQLNEKVRALVPYQPITGDYAVRLDANESFISIDTARLQSALDTALNRYPDPFASSLCDAFGRYYGVSPEFVTAGNGSDELISLIAGALFSSGETLVTLENDFSMYRFYGNVYGVKVDAFVKNDDLTIDVDRLIEHINDIGARGVIFSNPCNPTSLCMNRADVLKLIRGTDALVVVDEAYMDFADQSILDCCHNFDNVIVLRTCSKAVGLAAIRLGFAVANERLTTALRAVKSPYNVNAITQAVGELVLSDGGYLRECLDKILESRDSLYQQFTELHQEFDAFDEVYSTSTNFIFIKTKHAETIYNELLARSIAVRFMGGYLRISTGSGKENDILTQALRAILEII